MNDVMHLTLEEKEKLAKAFNNSQTKTIESLRSKLEFCQSQNQDMKLDFLLFLQAILENKHTKFQYQQRALKLQRKYFGGNKSET